MTAPVHVAAQEAIDTKFASLFLNFAIFSRSPACQQPAPTPLEERVFVPASDVGPPLTTAEVDTQRTQVQFGQVF